jgi:hypothetical protein
VELQQKRGRGSQNEILRQYARHVQNLVERLFAEITRQRIRRGTFDNVTQLQAAITDWIEHRNQNPKPFVWTAKPCTIIARYRRARATLLAGLPLNESEH